MTDLPGMEPEELARLAESAKRAEEANLRYVSDDKPGFSRQKVGKEFRYYDLEGKLIKDPKILERIDKLAIPPAWEDVWICSKASGHIQATGRDEKGRKQYRYHEKWNEISNEQKFHKMLSFSEILPGLRDRVDKDMNLSGLTQEKILATLVWLLENTYIRVGNEEYARENNHFGLTTLRNKHVEVGGGKVTFEFTGKSGKKHLVVISDPLVVKTLRKLEELPGYELFQYIDENGGRHSIDSQDVNDYLKQIAGDNVSAKDFRTWGGTVLSALTLNKMGEFKNKKQALSNINQAVKTVAAHLRNTPKICRTYYIHPVVPDTYQKKELVPFFLNVGNKKPIRNLTKDEFGVAELLRTFS
jgi:DNA topoisomerase-1